ncbi:hypothetical protein EYF80_012013 [Liparis tanakae]|uniref:Uncharacterized protein n=1 Tax=Liparis tanakae TaxID=230148 RepID=A0A4Z2IIX3_9TELE|nr:hypothetical protein EYF80_012013 [Liparis tanakae]
MGLVVGTFSMQTKQVNYRKDSRYFLPSTREPTASRAASRRAIAAFNEAGSALKFELCSPRVKDTVAVREGGCGETGRRVSGMACRSGKEREMPRGVAKPQGVVRQGDKKERQREAGEC